MTPPFATARTTARDVQLRGVPVPTQRSGRDVSTALAFPGTADAVPNRRCDGGKRCGERAGKGQTRRREYGLSIHGHLRLGTLATEP